MALELTRREFLTVNFGAVLAALTAPLIGLSITPGLSPDESHTLLAVTQTLFPPITGEETGYARALLGINDLCREDHNTFDSLKNSLASLNHLSGGQFADANELTRVKALKKFEDTDFFQIIFGETLESLYGSPELWWMMRCRVSLQVVRGD